MVSGLAIGPFMNIYTATVAVFGEFKTVETCITLERTVTLTKSTTVLVGGTTKSTVTSTITKTVYKTT
ncbi:MAG: hypothetical protein QXP49_05100 [Nitrososphaerota archaeon]